MDPGGYDPDPWQDPSATPTPGKVPAHRANPYAATTPTDPASAEPTHHNPPPRPQSSYIREGVAWSVVAACTLILFAMQLLGMQAIESQTNDDPRPGLDTIAIARNLVGTHQLGGEQADDVGLAQFDLAAEASGFPRHARVRSAILAGEVGSPEALARRLTALEDAETDADTPAAAELIRPIYTEQYVPTPAERTELIEAHGWIGELAATHALLDDDAERRAVRRSGTVMVIALSIFGLIVGGALLLGLVLLVVFIVLFAMRKLRPACPTGPAAHPTAYVETAALFLVLFIALQVVLAILQALIGINLLPLMLLLSPIALLWPFVVGVRWKQYKHDMGLHLGRGFFRETGATILGYLAGLPIIAAGMAVTAILVSLTQTSAEHPIQYEVMDSGTFGLLLILASMVVWAPLVEEAVFRSALYRHLRQVRGVPGWLVASVITGFVFAAIHPQGFAGIPALMSIAFVFSSLREWRGTVYPCMLAHAIHNGSLAVSLGILLMT